MFEALEYENSGPLAHNESRALFIKRARAHFGLIIHFTGHGLNSEVAVQIERVIDVVRRTYNDHICLVEPNPFNSLDDGRQSGGACGADCH
jgi:hypothetical protein